jgi:subtilase family serine protease
LPAAAPICGVPARVEAARCHSWRRTDHGGKPVTPRALIGKSPTDLQQAYGLTSISSSAGTDQVVAIVDAYHHPNASSDLVQYRSAANLPALCGDCFRQVNQNGAAGPYPAVDTGWAQEIALDIEMVSAICPNCKILLVEANSNSYADLGQAVVTAAKYSWDGLKTKAISNSYGGGEFSFESSYEAPYNQPGIAVTVSSGDAGYGVEFPAASRFVTAVGGTSLTKSGSTWSESVWNGAGSGCSRFISKPGWQTDSGCSKRTVADVAAVADPNTGVSVIYNGAEYIFGGTSVAAPIIASVYALAGNTGPSSTINPVSFLYGHAFGGTLFDVTSGSNGGCPKKTAYLCTGGKGYDGPTGLGTPRGIGAF